MAKECYLCGRRLVAIGNSRANGKMHNDWNSREFHKKCYLEVIKRPSIYKDEYERINLCWKG